MSPTSPIEGKFNMKSNHFKGFFPSVPVRIMWVYAVGVLALVIMGCCWYVGHIWYGAFQSVGHDLIYSLGTNTTQSDQIETFYTNVDTYILVLGCIGVLFWMIVYSMRKGREVYP